MNGKIVYIDKPVGISSFDVIRILRKKYNIRKMGHAGTLDPLASGLMIIAIGAATKQLNGFLKLPKTYCTTVRFGQKRDTGDLEGAVIDDMPVTLSMVSSLDNILEEMQGDIMLPVPIYSAIKKGGKRLYEKARNGEEVVPPKKEMHIEEMRCMGMEQHGTYVHADIEMRVSSGTYVRSIVEEIGRRLSVPATVASLRRTAIANISVRDSEKIDVGEYRSRISGNGK